MNKLKNVLSFLLGQNPGPPGRRWFVRDSSKRRVMNDDHLSYLVSKYIPDHRGLFWKEGQCLP